jgi:predicted dienelactone hydrolase
MKRGITVLLSLSVLLTAAYFTASKWAIRHEALTFNDPSRDNRPVTVDVAVRWDKEVQANAGMIKLPVAVLNHGNTVRTPAVRSSPTPSLGAAISCSALNMTCPPIRRW